MGNRQEKTRDKRYKVTKKDLLKHVNEIYNSQKQKFGKGELYQSYEPLGIPGRRSTSKRLMKYKLIQFLHKNQRVLDTGCNCGFISLRIAPYVLEIDGFDNNISLIKIANLVKQHLRITNVNFYSQSFDDFKANSEYDVILATAIHHWSNIGEMDFCDKMKMLLNPDGLLLFESHDIKKDMKYRPICKLLLKNFIKMHSGFTKDGVKRKFSLWRLVK